MPGEQVATLPATPRHTPPRKSLQGVCSLSNLPGPGWSFLPFLRTAFSPKTPHNLTCSSSPLGLEEVGGPGSPLEAAWEPNSQSFFFFFFINLFIYYWLHWVLAAARGLSLVVASGGHSSLRCAGFSLRWLLLLGSTGSRRPGFSSCGTWAQ